MSARWLTSALAALAVAGCGQKAASPADGGTCDDLGACAFACGAGVDSPPFEGATHVTEPTPVVYKANPPASGNHWPMWQEPWGAYPDGLPRERWVHNLEHGGIVLLYNCPSGCDPLVQQLTALRNSLQPDRFSVVRVLIVPDALMPRKVAAVAWNWRWQGDAYDDAALRCFIAARYDRGPESIP